MPEPSVVLLAPIGLDRGSWADIDVGDRPVVKHAFPGHGPRPLPMRPLDLGALADEVAEWYPGPLDVVGVSMGGMVAQHLGLRHPDRVRSLFLACTNAGGRAAVMQQRASAVVEGGMAAVLEETLARWFTPAALADPGHPGVAYARETLLALDAHAFAAGWLAIAGHDVRDRLPEVRARTTCVAASGDVASPPARVREVADAIPGARYVEVDGPHMLHLERPDVFSALLRDHLAWVDGG